MATLRKMHRSRDLRTAREKRATAARSGRDSMCAGAWAVDFVRILQKAPSGRFTRRPLNLTPQPQSARRQAARFSCRPHRVPIVYSTLRYFPPPKSRIKHPRACGSSARRSLADASVSHCRTVVRPLQRMRLERDADDNRTALITPSNARFTDLGMLVSRLTFIQQRSYDRRCRTSHSCQKRP